MEFAIKDFLNPKPLKLQKRIAKGKKVGYWLNPRYEITFIIYLKG